MVSVKQLEFATRLLQRFGVDESIIGDRLRVLISVWFLAYVWSGFGIVLLSLADRR